MPPPPVAGTPEPLDWDLTASMWAAAEEAGIRLGPQFQVLRAVGTRSGDFSAEVAPVADAPSLGLHTIELDALVQAGLGAWLQETRTPLQGLWLPMGAERVRLAATCVRPLRAVIQRLDHSPGETHADGAIIDATGRCVAQFQRLAYKALSAQALGIDLKPSARTLALRWRDVPTPASAPPVGWALWRDPELAALMPDLSLVETPTEVSGPVLVRADRLGQTPAEAAAALAELIRTAHASELLVVTRGAQSVDPACPPGGDIAAAERAAHGAALWGLIRTARQERPGLTCRLLDLAANASLQEVADRALFECGLPAEEPEIAWRRMQRFIPRMMALEPLSPGAGERRRLIPGPGGLTGLTWQTEPHRTPGPAEISIEVEAVPLNFRDVLTARGALDAVDAPLGLECVGRITAMGQLVDDFEIGDRVMALTLSAMGTAALAPAVAACRIPATMSAEAAATLTQPALTSWYGLSEVAQVKPGQTVLVHYAAGGVGYAAVQVARALGARVIGTASAPKQAAVLAAGAEAVFDSRTLDFAEAIERQVGQVDVVIAAVPRAHTERSLALLRPGGVYVELGKRDLLEPEICQALNPEARYAITDVRAVDVEGSRRFFQWMGAAIDRGDLRPLPHRTFSGHQPEAAFQLMSRGHHLGRVLLRMGTTFHVEPETTTLVTGALGGIGQRLCHWLIERGATHLALCGRRPASEVEGWLEGLRLQGATVRYDQVDLAARGAVEGWVSAVSEALPPIRAVHHAAGLLDDGLLAELTPDRFERVMAVKLGAALELDRLTRGRGLHTFALFASAAGVLGSPGQANYAAANAGLDALARARQAAGEVGTSVAWGPWAEVGMAARLDEAHQRRLEAMGITPLAVEEGLDTLGRALAEGLTCATVLDVDVARVNAGIDPRLSELTAEEATGPSDALKLILAAPEAERGEQVERFVLDTLARVLGSDEGVQAQRPLERLGLDSLLALELVESIERALQVRLKPAELWDCATPADIAALVFTKLPGAPVVEVFEEGEL